MKIVIDKESIINVFTIGFYATLGGDYNAVKDVVKELLEKIDYEPYEERPEDKGECPYYGGECDYYNFAQTFIDGIVKVMKENHISSVEELSRIFRGKEE